MTVKPFIDPEGWVRILTKENQQIRLDYKGEITAEQLQDLKSKAAQERAKNIELEANAINQKLSQLVQDKVDGKFKDTLKDTLRYS